MQQPLWTGAVAAVLLAIGSGLAERRRRGRRDPDDVGLIPWIAVQLFALLAALVLVSVALNSPQ